jgi:antitoxin component YwqK of YwqJK toxin-antitoxin module
MKFYSLLFFALVCCLKGFSQEKKLYLTADGKFKNDSLNAFSYVLIQKIDDTTYMISQYSLKEVILTKGYYKDSTAKIPNGKFYYYKERYIKQVNSALSEAKPDVYIEYLGHFKNGKKTGKWVEYAANGNKSNSYTYEDDKLNGEYQSINKFTGRVITIGNYINNKKEGNWDTYNVNFEKPEITDCYLHNKLIRTIYHFERIHLPANFTSYLRKSLHLYIDTIMNQNITVAFLIRENGKADSIQVKNTDNKEINSAIVAAVLNAPKFNPATYDSKPMKYEYSFNFKTVDALEEVERTQERRKENIVLRHANDIGRGLNSVGFGKPVVD